MSFLRVDSIVKRFSGVLALNDISFSVEEQDFVGIMGANGAGKTTLFSIIAGNLRPDDGSVVFDNERIDGRRPDQISRRGVARTFQIVRPFGNLTVLENIALGALYGRGHERSLNAAEEKAKKIIDLLGLTDRTHVMARHLTLAGRKRLEIARSLATEPRLLLLDEVLAGLTPTEVSSAVEVIRDFHKTHQVTIVMIEHVTRALMALCKRVVVLHHGQKIAEGSPLEVANDPLTLSAYFGSAPS